MDLILYILAGAAVGLAVGITGVGGGSLMTPMLIMFGFPLQVAIGTDLLYASVTKAGGIFAHHRLRTIRWRIVFLLAAGSIPASLLTTYLLRAIFDGANDYAPLLTTSLGVMLILTALVLLFKSRIVKPNPDKPSPPPVKHSGKITFIVGILLGIFVTLTSVGAGAFAAAVLLLLYPRLPALHVVGTDLAHAVPLTLVAGLGHLVLLGNVDFTLLGSLLIGSLPAIWIGTRIGAKLPNNVLQPILATILLVIGTKFAFF